MIANYFTLTLSKSIVIWLKINFKYSSRRWEKKYWWKAYIFSINLASTSTRYIKSDIGWNCFPKLNGEGKENYNLWHLPLAIISPTCQTTAEWTSTTACKLQKKFELSFNISIGKLVNLFNFAIWKIRRTEEPFVVHKCITRNINEYF